MSNLPLSADEKAQKWGTAVKWIAFAVVGFLVSPFILATIEGIAGLVVVGIMCAAIHFLSPVFQQMAINLRLKLIKDEATRNPVETLEAEELRLSIQLEDKKNAIAQFNAKVITFGGKIEEYKRKHPGEGVPPEYQGAYDKMKELVHQQGLKWIDANKNYQLFQGVVEKSRDIWALAQAANAAKIGSGLGEDEFYAKLKVTTAYDSIQNNMNLALSDLDTMLLEADADNSMKNVTPQQQSLPAANSNVIDIGVTKTKSKTV